MSGSFLCWVDHAVCEIIITMTIRHLTNCILASCLMRFTISLTLNFSYLLDNTRMQYPTKYCHNPEDCYRYSDVSDTCCCLRCITCRWKSVSCCSNAAMAESVLMLPLAVLWWPPPAPLTGGGGSPLFIWNESFRKPSYIFQSLRFSIKPSSS